jgi:hypothetical protein
MFGLHTGLHSPSKMQRYAAIFIPRGRAPDHEPLYGEISVSLWLRLGRSRFFAVN